MWKLKALGLSPAVWSPVEERQRCPELTVEKAFGRENFLLGDQRVLLRAGWHLNEALEDVQTGTQEFLQVRHPITITPCAPVVPAKAPVWGWKCRQRCTELIYNL